MKKSTGRGKISGNGQPVLAFRGNSLSKGLMQLFTTDKALQWGSLDLPLQGITADWEGRSLSPPAAFSLAADDANLWFVATRQASAMTHPEAVPGAFTPGLWKYDVAELFIADADGGGYLEFNLAANGAWWACRFHSARKPGFQPNFVEAVSTHHDATLPGTWLSALVIPVGFLRENVGFGSGTRANVTFILNSPDQTFHSASELPGSEPDFHQPQSFRALIPVPLSGR